MKKHLIIISSVVLGIATGALPDQLCAGVCEAAVDLPRVADAAASIFDPGGDRTDCDAD